jgi:hypothetical protein
MAAGTYVDDAQPTVPEDDATVCALPQAAVVGPAVDEEVAHPGDERAIAFGVTSSAEVKLPDDAAHVLG